MLAGWLYRAVISSFEIIFKTVLLTTLSSSWKMVARFEIDSLFFLSWRGGNLVQRLLGLLDQTTSESTQSKLHQRSIEKNLQLRVGSMDGGLQVRQQQHVTGLEVLIVESIVVNVVENGLLSEHRVWLFVEHQTESVDQSVGIFDSLWTRLGQLGVDRRVQRLFQLLPHSVLAENDELGWLEVDVVQSLQDHSCQLVALWCGQVLSRNDRLSSSESESKPEPESQSSSLSSSSSSGEPSSLETSPASDSDDERSSSLEESNSSSDESSESYVVVKNLDILLFSRIDPAILVADFL
ncbi:hypothetical protein OGAPHI_002250 [Ogataea philodendri]|uniref:Uncharacterized protein n=1 Tax=Ogataea philodendri TaxID=1378263 RepID=A0A9P8T801_9ASCO|nr:uncharacterized protein OGAPHI_002250 [Ogataea philodendri]KAH3668496.1 hypothetical protein OGAPHI_002250 [Ogataea philodendri]